MIASSIVGFQVPSKIIVVETVCSQVHQHSRYIAMFTPTAESNVWLLFVAEQEDNTHEKNRDTEPKEYHSVLLNQNELKEAKMLREFKRSCRVG